MKISSLPAWSVLIAIVLIVQSVAVCEAQNGNAAIANAMKRHRLYNPQGDDLGRIDGVTFDNYRRPAFIILSVMDNKIVPIPFSALVPGSARDRFVVNITKDQIWNAPGYSINAENNFLNCYAMNCPMPW